MRFSLGLETSDGWQPYRISLDGTNLDSDTDGTFLPFVSWLISMIAYDRLQQPWLTTEDRDSLTAIMNTTPTPTDSLREGAFFGSRSVSIRQVIPGYIPISATLHN